MKKKVTTKDSPSDIIIVSHINELICQTEVIQYFKNNQNTSVELEMIIPQLSNCFITKFEVVKDNRLIISRILEKEKAKEKYTDSITTGNSSLVSYNIDNFDTQVCLGNIAKGEEIELKTYFFGHIENKDLSYQAKFPIIFPDFEYQDPEDGYFRNYIKKNIKGKIYIDVNSKITRLIVSSYKNFDKISTKFSQDKKSAIIDIVKDNFSEKDIPGIILFRTEKINDDILYYQYDPKKKKSYYMLQKTLNPPVFNKEIKDDVDQDENIKYISILKNKEIEEIEKDNVCYIFLLDQSGSMSGERIELCKNSLLLFLQSLNEKCYFLLIRFGSTYEYYTDKPLEYNKINIKNIMDKIKNLSADKGGTELYKPLIDIYENKIFIDYKMKKNIILLTDGELSDKEKVINLIGSNAKNFLFNSIGIGNCDKDLIERTALMGNGYSCYINNLNTLNTNVISLLEKTQNLLCVECISNQKPSIEDQNIKPIQINDYFTHGFILDEINMKDIEFSIKPNEKDIIKISFDKNNITKLPDGDKLGKLIVDNYLKSGECKDKNIRIKLSKEYNILISETAFFAEMTNDVAIQDKMIKKTNKNKKALNNIEEAKPKSQNNKADDEEINDEFDFRINLFGNNIYLNDDDESIERIFVKYREERLYFGLSYDIERPPQKENWFKSIYKKIINKIGIIKRKIYKYKQKKITKKEYYECADKCACPNDFIDEFSLDNLDLQYFKKNVNEDKISFKFYSPKK